MITGEMKMYKSVILIVNTAFLILFLFSLSSSMNAPTVEIKSTIESILDVLRDKDLHLSANKAKRRKIIRSLITDRFDFEEMAKRSLARHWKKRTPEEKKEFIVVFSKLLEASYIRRIEAYTNEKITYDKEKLKGGGKYGIVNTTIITENVNIPINYKVLRKGNEWRVYDVVIEGVSFISTYRNQYNRIIKKESYAKLIQKMKDKLEDADNL
jgi:phospholipid transport system substrate-binding protein